MSAYPNYWAPQPIPNQYQNVQPMPNPYMDRVSQLQQYQQSLQQPQFQPQVQAPGIIGRVVNDFSEITANDVPMNGNAAFFPKSDGTELQVRSWTPNGTIQTVVYRPVLEQNPSEATNTPQMDFNALNEDVRALREEISARFDRLEQSMAAPTAKATRAKKGDAENERSEREHSF